WWTWWLGDMTGVLLFAPALVVWAGKPWRSITRARAFEAAAIGAVLVAGALWPDATRAYPLNFLCMPVLLWAAVRLDQGEAAACVLILSAVALWSTARGEGPFSWASPGE